MVNQRMQDLGNVRSAIRELFEFGKKQKELLGEDQVFDFSLGNPNVPSPPAVKQTILELLEEDPSVLHGYTSAQGDARARGQIAAWLNQQHGTDFTADQLYMTCGAAASVKITITALHTEGDEFLAITPFFPEYRVFAESAGAKFVTVSSNPENFLIDFEQLETAINQHTKAILINSPNNPCGVVYPERDIIRLSALLEEKSKEYGHPVYLIADEPYRELVYDDTFVPFVSNYYKDAIICYSYSKSLSLPGERIGYILMPRQLSEYRAVYAAVCGTGRALGFVCAPSLFQRVAALCTGQTADLSIYRKNRDLLYENLTKMGFSCIYPQGAFYLFMKAPDADAGAFAEKAKEFNLLLVPGDSFGTPGFVRISYCVQTEMIERSLPAFQKLAEAYADQ